MRQATQTCGCGNLMSLPGGLPFPYPDRGRITAAAKLVSADPGQDRNDTNGPPLPP